MKFAFSTVGSEWASAAIAATAKEHGYDGVELNFPGAVPAVFESVEVEVACLSGGRGIAGQRNEDQARAEHIRTLIDLASGIGCALVKVGENPLRLGQNRAASGLALGHWLLPLADYAADHGVGLALNNTQSLRTARETWAILDRLNHPSLGCCLDVLTAARIGDSPEVMVPMLNSRIAYVQVRDVKDLAEPERDCELGDGVVPIKTTIARLRGIGYSGWITVRLPGTLETVGPGSSRAIAVLRQWSQPVEQKKAKVKASR